VWNELGLRNVGEIYGKKFGSQNSPTFLKSSSFYTHLRAYEDGTECSETSAYKIQTPGNYPEEVIQHPEHGESLKSRTKKLLRNLA
jgi:hypothetical protein